jgi:hypothetical protein
MPLLLVGKKNAFIQNGQKHVKHQKYLTEVVDLIFYTKTINLADCQSETPEVLSSKPLPYQRLTSKAASAWSQRD